MQEIAVSDKMRTDEPDTDFMPNTLFHKSCEFLFNREEPERAPDILRYAYSS
jgi:hypothetical protein